MKPMMNDPYRSPHESAGLPITNAKSADARLSTVALTLSAVAIAVPFAVAFLVEINVITMHWTATSSNVPMLTIAGAFTFALFGLVLSIVSTARRRNWKGIVGISLAILAFPCAMIVSLLMAWSALAMDGTTSHWL